MHSRKQIKQSKIIIISLKTKRSKEISSYLQSKLDVDCSHSSSINSLGENRIDSSSIILLDAETLQAEGYKSKSAEQSRHTPTVFFNVCSQSNLEKEAILMGCKGVFLKNYPLDLIGKGIISILKGNLWFSRQVLQELVTNKLQAANDNISDTSVSTYKEENSVKPLSNREDEILLLVYVVK